MKHSSDHVKMISVWELLVMLSTHTMRQVTAEGPSQKDSGSGTEGIESSKEPGELVPQTSTHLQKAPLPPPPPKGIRPT
jgi:hypothetical protein